MTEKKWDVIVIGAGFAGLLMLLRLRELGLRARVLEAADDVGGTWYWNRYPGARCDVESLQYSYSFSNDLQQEWDWSERYASQPEILRYINHVAERFDLRRDIQFNTRVRAMSFDEATATWTTVTEAGEQFVSAFCVAATGCLSVPKDPEIDGIGTFRGEIYQTGKWPKERVDFKGKRVAVIGTGSSAIQCIPIIAGEAKHLTVFQRTASFSVPAKNAPLRQEDVSAWKKDYSEHRRKGREETPSGTLFDFSPHKAIEVDETHRTAEYERRWQNGGANFLHSFNDLLLNQTSNDTAADFVRAKIKEIVSDPEVASELSPSGYPLGAKRICLDTDYYKTFNRPNVRLVNLRKTPIQRISPTGIEIKGEKLDVDCIVFATGFDAVTGALGRIDIRGVSGLSLREKWKEGPKTYLGLMSAGFPNFFTITGPGSPSVISNVIVSIEQHVEWIANCLADMTKRNFRTIEATQNSEDEWVDHVRQVAEGTLFPKAASWYMGANVPGKPRVFLPYVGGVANYRKICQRIADDGYPGFLHDASFSTRSV